jgi:hypothetical protein
MRRNRLDIHVANLGRNRLVGDAALPVVERLAWSPLARFSLGTPLSKSGWLGRQPSAARTQSRCLESHLADQSSRSARMTAVWIPLRPRAATKRFIGCTSCLAQA